MMWDNNSWLARFLGWVEEEAGQFAALMACMLISFMTVLLLGTFVGIIVKSLEVLL